MKRRKILTAIGLAFVVLAVTAVLTGCGTEPENFEMQGNSAIVVLCDENRTYQDIITEEDDVAVLKDAFSGEYMERNIARIDDSRADYIICFGDKLSPDEDYFSRTRCGIIEDRAYMIVVDEDTGDETKYLFSKKIDPKLLEKYWPDWGDYL